MNLVCSCFSSSSRYSNMLYICILLIDCYELPFSKIKLFLRILYPSTVFLSFPSISLTIPTSSMPPNYLLHLWPLLYFYNYCSIQTHTNSTPKQMYVILWSQCCSNVSVFIAGHLGLDNLTWSLCLEKTDLLLSLGVTI